VTSDVDATPDELLLELMDLLVLAFPEPLQTARVVFRRSDDGTRPALTDLSGVALPGAPKRPDLGHDDAFVLDSINSLLVDLHAVFERDADLHVPEGRIDVERDGDDGSTWVYLIEKGAQPADDRVRMKRRFDQSELGWLYFTVPLFAQLAATEERERAQRAAFDAEVARFTKFAIDMQAGTITFSAPDGAATTMKFQLLGSWNAQTRRFLWGHANDQIAPALREGVERKRRASTELGLRAFTETDVGCPEPMADRLARHAAVWMGARGVYRAPFKSREASGFMYLAID
jgi:hypothetical protein